MLCMRKIAFELTTRSKGKALAIFFLFCLSLFLLGCTDTTYVVASDKTMPHLFGIADETQDMVALNTWQEVDFNYNIGHAYDFTPDGNCILVQQKGHYIAILEVHMTDDSPNPASNGAIRITQNGLEVSGSYSEISFDKQSAEREITTFGYIDANVGGKLCMEWIGSDIDIRLFESNNWADQPVVAKGWIDWVHKD